MNYFLRVLIAFDGFVQSMLRYGTHGVTISSRAYTAAAHEKRWGEWAVWLLDRVFGKNHCRDATVHDIQRARAAIRELNDPVVVKWRRRKTPCGGKLPPIRRSPPPMPPVKPPKQ